MTNFNQACGLNYGTCKHGRPLTQGCFECAQEKYPLDQFSELQAQLLAWEELWRSIKEMEPKLGDRNKPLAIAASYALLSNKLVKFHDIVDAVNDLLDAEDRHVRGEPFVEPIVNESMAKLRGLLRPAESPKCSTHRLQYNKLTRKIDRVSLVTGLVADSFDPPEECY